MRLKSILLLSFILCHALVNCVWAAAHTSANSGEGYEAPHVHLLSQQEIEHQKYLSGADQNNDHDEDADHDESAHVHLLLHVSHKHRGNFELDAVAPLWPSSPFYLSLYHNPPVPPPNF